MRGDCSIRVGGLGFSRDDIDACVQRTGLLSFELELSNSPKCECKSCRSGQGESRSVLSLEEVRSLVDQAEKLGCRRVILVDEEAGSCPFLNPLLADLAARGMDVELFAGFSTITAEQARFLAAHGVAVSLELDSLARVSSDRDFVAALDCLRDADNASNQPGKLAARISVHDGNIDEIPAIWRWARTGGIEPRVQIITPREGGGNGRDETLLIEPARSRRLFEELGRIDREEFGRAWELPPSLTGRSCNRHQFACHVSACGTIFACVGVTIPLGNIRAESLADILSTSEVLENLRDFKQRVKEPCGACCKSTDCYGCRGAAYQLTGDYLAGDQLCWKSVGVQIPRLPVDAGDLIPHGPSMRMIDRVMQVGERQARADFTVPADSPWVDAAGRLDDAAHIELIAQAFAALHTFHLSAEERAYSRGLLLGVKDLKIIGDVRAGDHLLIHIWKVTRFGDFGIVDGQISLDNGTIIATGQIKIWRRTDSQIAKGFIP